MTCQNGLGKRGSSLLRIYRTMPESRDSRTDSTRPKSRMSTFLLCLRPLYSCPRVWYPEGCLELALGWRRQYWAQIVCAGTRISLYGPFLQDAQAGREGGASVTDISLSFAKKIV